MCRYEVLRFWHRYAVCRCGFLLSVGCSEYYRTNNAELFLAALLCIIAGIGNARQIYKLRKRKNRESDWKSSLLGDWEQRPDGSEQDKEPWKSTLLGDWEQSGDGTDRK